MATESLADKLVYPPTGTVFPITTSLPPECALILITWTLSTPATFILNHFLQETLKANADNGAVFLSFHYDFFQQSLQMNRLVRYIFGSFALTALGNKYGPSPGTRPLQVHRRILSTFHKCFPGQQHTPVDVIIVGSRTGRSDL